ncbi:hypothetical protein BH10PSE6_BH10PSE6_47230 [soil metagenome]
MDRAERDLINRLNRAAEEEKTSGDPHSVQPKETTPLIVMVAVTLAVTAIVLGVLWMSNGRDDGASPRPVAEQQGQ